MDDTKLDVKIQAASGGDVSSGESAILSKDEQKLATLGYKQGIGSSNLRLLPGVQ